MTRIAATPAFAAAGPISRSETAFRAALAVDPNDGTAAAGLARLLCSTGRADEALALTTPFALSGSRDAGLLSVHYDAQTLLGLAQASVETCIRLVEISPASGVAEHNLAARLGDLRRYAEAEKAADRAFAKGLDAPETWLVYGRALQGQDKYDAAEAAYRRALAGANPCLDAHLDLAQLIWMRMGDVHAASGPLDAAIAGAPDHAQLAHFKWKLLDCAGDKLGAYNALAMCIRQSHQSTVELELQAADAALALGDLKLAAFHGGRAAAVAPDDTNVLRLDCDLNLALGRGLEAVKAAERLHALMPTEQSVLARLATAWRLAGDPRYQELYDFEQFVGSFVIETPQGWPDLGAYLADLTTGLEATHQLNAHPLGQSLRGGSQTMQNLLQSDNLAIRAFFEGIDQPIRQYIARLGKGGDPLRRQNLGGYRFAGAWSVKLRPNGFHTDHVHPKGWLSSAFYVETPKAINGGGREGWIKFGQPGTPTSPPLDAEYWVKPEPGRLVLFPSYMWHGTAPFTSNDRRLTIAFDLVADQPSQG